MNKCVYTHFDVLNFRMVFVIVFSEIKGKKLRIKWYLRKNASYIFRNTHGAPSQLPSCFAILQGRPPDGSFSKKHPVSQASLMNVHTGPSSRSFTSISTINSLQEKQTLTHVSL